MLGLCIFLKQVVSMSAILFSLHGCKITNFFDNVMQDFVAHWATRKDQRKRGGNMSAAYFMATIVGHSM